MRLRERARALRCSYSPAGGYEILAMDLEGTEVCDWLTRKGITCVLLKYRVPGEVSEVGTLSEIRAVSGITDGVGRRAKGCGTGALSRGGVAVRSAQDWSARIFGGRAFVGSDQQSLRKAVVSTRGCGRQTKVPPRFCSGHLSG